MYSLLNSSVRLLYAALMLQQDYLGRFVPITQCRGGGLDAAQRPTQCGHSQCGGCAGKMKVFTILSEQTYFLIVFKWVESLRKRCS